MKKGKMLMAVSIMMMLCTGLSFAEDGITVDVSSDFFNKYVWRGQDLVDDWVFQPCVSVGYGGFTAAFWGNMDLTNENTANGEFTEIDLSLDYSAAVPGIDWLGYSVGLIHYDFPVKGSGDDTIEFYAGISLDVPASPSATLYYDVDEVKGGMYFSFGVGHSFEDVFNLCPDTAVGVDISASFGWANGDYNKGYWGMRPDGGSIGSAMNDLVLSVACPFELAGFDVTASVNYVTLVNDDIRKTDAYGRGRDDMLFAGIGFAKGY